MRVSIQLAAGIAVLALAACGDAVKDETAASVSLDSALQADLARARTDTGAFSEAADVAMANPEPGEQSVIEEPIPESAPVTNRVPTTRVSTSTGDVGMRTNSPSTPPRSVPTPLPRPAPPTVPAANPTAAAVPSKPTPGAVASKPIAAAPAESYAANACASPALPDQRRCLLSYLARSDVALDRNYQAVIATLKRDAGVAPGEKEPASVERLRVAQRSWLVYRDTECRRRNRDKEGPLWAPVRARCLAEFSGQRTDELAQELAKLRAR